MSDVILISVGRELGIYSLFGKSCGKMAPSTSTKTAVFVQNSINKILNLVKAFNSPSSMSRPKIFQKLSETSIVMACGKSLIVWKHEPILRHRPIYAPENLQHLINLGKIETVRTILENLKNAHNLPKDGPLKASTIENFFLSSPHGPLEYEVPKISSLLNEENITTKDGDDNIFANSQKGFGEFSNEVEMEEETLKLSFDSDDTEENEENMEIENLTVDSVLTKYTIAGIDRTDQVYLQAISESISTSIPAGVDEPGISFLLGFSNLNYVQKYFGGRGRAKVNNAILKVVHKT